jgi:DNA-binding transcriptional LysR family regulator
MDNNSPSLNDLKYFAEIASCGNISKAARRLGVTQPALTIAIQRLENSMGSALLARGKKGISLTKAGQNFLRFSKELIEEWQNVKARTVASQSEIRGSYRVGCNTQVGLLCLPKVLPDLIQEHRGIDIQLVHDKSDAILDAVLGSQIDIGIVVDVVRHPDLMIKKVCSGRVKLWTAAEKSYSQDYQAGTATLLYNPNMVEAFEVMRKLKKGPVKYQRTLSSTSIEILASLATAGMGIAILPELALKAMDVKSLKPVPESPIVVHDVFVVYRIENRKVAAIQEILNRIVKVFESV